MVSFEGAHIKIKSNDSQLIFEVLDYFEFVGLTLSKKYFVEGKKEQIRFEEIEKRLLRDEGSVVLLPKFENVIALERYLDKAAEAEQMILISRPFPPQRTSISTHLILTIAIILGGASGVFTLLVRQAYRARKLKLAGLEA